MAEPLIPNDAYLSLEDANSLAVVLPELTAYNAATDAEKTAALLQATIDLDAAMAYQGRPYDVEQYRQFPRTFAIGSSATPSQVWAWDDDADEAIVPADVRRATLYQADVILAGDREARLSAQHDGVVYELTGTVAESYKFSAGPGVPTGLCRRAWVIMRRYRLRSGALL